MHMSGLCHTARAKDQNKAHKITREIDEALNINYINCSTNNVSTLKLESIC